MPSVTEKARKPITLIVHWHNPALDQVRVYSADCQYCGVDYTLSAAWPFTNICNACAREELHDLLDLVDALELDANPSLVYFKPALDRGWCSLCHHYDPRRDPEHLARIQSAPTSE